MCDLFERWMLPLAQMRPRFCEGMCLRLLPEPRILLVLMRWQSDKDADEYYEQVFPTITLVLSPLIDRIAVRGFEVGVRVTSTDAA